MLLGALILLVAVRLPSLFRESSPPRDGESALVERVIDGDTLLLSGGTRVRLLGVDTPETKHPQRPVEALGEEAAKFTRSRVEGRRVILRFDRERVDPYGRRLAYVEVDNECLNVELVRAGLSRAETGFPIRQAMKRRLQDAEAEANSARRGLWAIGNARGTTD